MFRANWPGIQIVLREARDSAELIHAVESGDIDVTFLDIGPYDTGPLHVRLVLDDPMVFLAPAGSPEAGRRVITMADVARLPMIGTRDPGCRQIIEEAFRQAPTSPSYVFRSDNHPTIHGLIGSGLAYAVLPLLAVDENDPKVAIIPIRPAPPPRRLGIAWHPGRRPPPALVPFVEAAADVSRDLSGRWAESHAARGGHAWAYGTDCPSDR